MNIIYIYVYSHILLILLMVILYENCSFLIWYSFIGQFVHSVGEEGLGFRMWMVGIVILASWEYNFNKVHENLVQYPCNNKSITLV